jgi:two-component system chemotaxis response regulator CheY
MACNVLIVDDSPAMRKVIRRVLALSGFSTGACLEAGDGLEALDVLEHEAVDLVLTDVNMPNMNGEELIEKMSEHPTYQTLPVLVISTDRSDQRLCRMLALGARGYITKPFAPKTLSDELIRVMEEEAL